MADTTVSLLLACIASCVCVADGLLTYRMVKRGASERNPFFAKLIARFGISRAVLLSRSLVVPLLVIVVWLNSTALGVFAVVVPSLAVALNLRKASSEISRG